MNNQICRLISFDSTIISYYRVKASGAPKALIFILHGMGEHAGRYLTLAESLAAVGVECWCPDLRGFGRSGGRRGHCNTFDDYKRDLEVLFQHAQREYRGVPIFLLGHSFGGLVVSYSAAKSSIIRPAGIILSSPLFQIFMKVPAWQKVLAGVASVLYPILAQNNGVDPSVLTHDEDITLKRKQDPLIHAIITPRLYVEMQKAMRQRAVIAVRIHCPVFLLQAGDDRIVSKKVALQFYDELAASTKDKRLYEGWYHEILNEVGRGEVFSQIAQWLLKHT